MNEILKQSGYNIQLLEDPCFVDQMQAVISNPNSIQWIKNPHKLVQLKAVEQDGYCLQYIKHIADDEVITKALQTNGYALFCLEQLTEQQMITAVTSTPQIIQRLDNPSADVQIQAYKQNKNVLRFIKTPSEKLKLYIKMEQIQ